MTAFLPTCSWCGRPMAAAPVVVQHGPTAYTVHEGDCEDRTRAYAADDDALEALHARLEIQEIGRSTYSGLHPEGR